MIEIIVYLIPKLLQNHVGPVEAGIPELDWVGDI
jgi:hypothetical protein